MKKWVVNFDGFEEWNFSDEFKTKEDAIASGKEELYNDFTNLELYQEFTNHETFEIGQFELFTPTINVDQILSDLEDDAYEDCSESSSGWLTGISDEDKKVLSLMFSDTLQRWLSMTNREPSFGRVTDIEKIETGLFDIESGVNNNEEDTKVGVEESGEEKMLDVGICGKTEELIDGISDDSWRKIMSKIKI